MTADDMLDLAEFAEFADGAGEPGAEEASAQAARVLAGWWENEDPDDLDVVSDARAVGSNVYLVATEVDARFGRGEPEDVDAESLEAEFVGGSGIPEANAIDEATHEALLVMFDAWAADLADEGLDGAGAEAMEFFDRIRGWAEDVEAELP